MGNKLASDRARTFKEFQTDVGEAKEKMLEYPDEEGNVLGFQAVPQREEDIAVPLFWRHGVKVVVWKEKKAGVSLSSSSDQWKCTLSFWQFYMFLRQLRGLVAASEIEEPAESASMECGICFEHSANTVLPCTHAFCGKCVEEWYRTHQTCPLCREIKDHSFGEDWILSEGPSNTTLASHLQDFLARIAETTPPR